jgi:hypothetical protein
VHPLIFHRGEQRKVHGILWPFCGHFVAILWPFCGHFVAILWPFCGRFVAILWPFCGHIVAVLWPYCGRFVAIHEAFCGHSRGMAVVWPLHGCRVVRMVPASPCASSSKILSDLVHTHPSLLVSSSSCYNYCYFPTGTSINISKRTSNTHTARFPLTRSSVELRCRRDVSGTSWSYSWVGSYR